MFVGYFNRGTESEPLWEAYLHKDEFDNEFLVRENTKRKLLISIIEMLSERPQFQCKLPAIVMGSGYHACLRQLNKLYKGEDVSELKSKIADYKRRITHFQREAHEKNLKLDALHYVWCSGGCEGGVHRWVPGKVTKDIVDQAERSVARLKRWYINNEYKKKFGKPAPRTIPEALKELNKCLKELQEAADKQWGNNSEVIPVVHNMGVNPCNKVAFYWLGDIIKKGERLDSSRIQMLDGSIPDGNSAITCGSCGMKVGIITPEGVGRIRELDFKNKEV